MDFFSWQGIVALLLGGLYGAVFGAVPGLTATLAVALFIPMAFFLDPVVALPAIIAISSVAIYAGDVGAVLARIPGTPASAAYADEIYGLARRKGPIYSLGISAVGSSVGGLLGTGLLVFSATGLAAVATGFASFEYFWIAVLGLTAGIFAAGESPLKGFVSLLLGLLLAAVGVDPTLGYPRFDFGSPQLLGGLDYVVVMIGLFGFSEVLEHLYRPGTMRHGGIPATRGEPVWQFYARPLRLIARQKGLVLRSSLLGVFVGFLPGAGADVGAWVSSSVQKVVGGRGAAAEAEGDVEDRVVLAGTSSNNAAVASAWIPALSLGLPGDTVTAIVLGVFLMKGITPGPMLFETNPGLVWSLYGAFLVSNVLLLPLYGFLTARMAAWLVNVPFNLLLSVIAGLCTVGAYAINNDTFDVWVMAGAGAFAFALRRGGFPLAQVVLGMVLGPILEQSFMVSAVKSHWDLGTFFSRPVALVLMALTVLIVVVGTRMTRQVRREREVAERSEEEQPA